jgi:GR25 family glycosyltransferase involved in LPS biosynthesis
MVNIEPHYEIELVTNPNDADYYIIVDGSHDIPVDHTRSIYIKTKNYKNTQSTNAPINNYWLVIDFENNNMNISWDLIKTYMDKRFNNEKYTNELFDKIYLLNIDKYPQRLLDSDYELRLRHIKYQRYDTIDGTTLTVPKMITDKIITSKFDAKRRPGVLGLTATHFKFLNEQVANNYNLCLYFEDDIRLHHQFCDQIADNWQHIPDDADIVSLSHWFLKGNINTHTVHIKENVYKLIKNINSMACVVFTLNGAKKMLAKQFPISRPVDNFDCNIFTTYVLGKIPNTDPNFYIDTTTMPKHKINLSGIAVTRNVPSSVCDMDKKKISVMSPT